MDRQQPRYKNTPMEHRCSLRKPLALHTLVYKHGLPVQAGASRDISFGGMFVENKGHIWRKNEMLEVEFSICADPSIRMKINCIVVHYNEHGAGLIFEAVTSQQHKQLQAWLFGKDGVLAAEQQNGYAVQSAVA